MTQAFEGIRIIDFTQVLAGPFATQQLAQLGADVIKIEQPGSGDQTRGLLADTDHGGMSPAFLTCNLGKRSLTLNLKAAEAKEIVHALVAGADAVVENFKPGVMARLGFGYDHLVAVRPDLVFCSISGYGQQGPKSHLPAYDGAIQAASGMMAITGHPETGPTRTGYMPVDMATALNAAFALAAALYRRRETGLGQRLDVAMMDTAMVLQAPQMSNHLVNGGQPELFGNRSPTRQPTANVFATADGHIQIVALKEPQVAALFEVLDLAECYGGEQFATPAARVSNTLQVNSLITGALVRRSTLEWVDLLEAAHVPVAEIRVFAEVAADDQFNDRSAFTEVPSPHGEGTVQVVGAGYTAGADGPRPTRPPPRLGEHTDELLGEIGWSQQRIDELRTAGVV